MTSERELPPRLLDLPGPAGECLRQALAEPLAHPQISNFDALRERRQRRVRNRQALVLALCAVSGVAASWVLGRPEKATPRIVAELVQPSSVSPEPEPPTVAPETVPSASAVPAQPKPARRASPRTAGRTFATAPAQRAEATQTRDANELDTAPPVSNQSPSVASTSSATPPRSVSTPGAAKTCAELARAGASEQAMACYEQLALGTGISAELALFEQARLAAKVLHRPDLALATLERYRARFPHGSLKAEVMLAMIDGLLALGDKARALDEVDRALSSGLVRERQEELLRLRETLSRPASPIRSD